MSNRRSFYAFLVSVLVILYCSLIFHPRWNKEYTEATISWDVSGYYWPLPSLFIYKDVQHQRFADGIIDKYKPTNELQQVLYLKDKDVYIYRYTFGTAITYFPFFAIAHMVAEPLGYDADGFSTPYQVALQLGGLLMAIIGLWYARKLFLKYDDDVTVAVLLLVLCIGTNYLNYAAIDTALPHSWLFTWYVLLILNTITFYERPTAKYALRIGLLIGLMTLIRPSEAIACIIPLLWGLNSLSADSIKERIRFLFSRFRLVFLAGVCMVLLFFTQLLYWKLIAGHWKMDLYYGQGFSFAHPHFYNYILSFRSGWLVYTPMMLFAFVGLVPFLKRGKNKVAVVLFFFVSLYIVASWDQWWYAGSGGRAMIQSYPILLFPVASLIAYVRARNITKWLFLALAAVFAYVNIWFTYHAHKGKLYSTETMNQQYFWRVVGRWSAPEEVNKMMDYDEFYAGQPQDMRLIYSNNFEADTSLHNKDVVIEGSVSYMMDKEHKSSGWLMFAMPAYRADRLRVQATYHCVWQEWDINKWAQLMVRFYHKNEVVKEKMIYVDRYLSTGVRKDIFIDLKIPQKADSAGVSFWGPEVNKPLYIDNLKAWTFDEE